jgi:hypothetical protein
MPEWLALTFKILVMLGTVAILVGMTIVVRDFWTILTRKVTMIILYLAIVGALVLNAVEVWLIPSFREDYKFICDEINIFALFLLYVFVQICFITSFECLYSLKYKLKEREHQTQITQQENIKRYRFRFGLAIFCLITLDVVIVSVIQGIYINHHLVNKEQHEKVLPASIEYFL